MHARLALHAVAFAQGEETITGARAFGDGAAVAETTVDGYHATFDAIDVHLDLPAAVNARVHLSSTRSKYP